MKIYSIEERKKIRDAIERIYTDYAVTSFDVLHEQDEPTQTIYVLKHIRLIGIPKSVACGKGTYDSCPMDQILNSIIVSVSKQMELDL